MESHTQSKLVASYLIVEGLPQEVELLPELLARHRRLLLVDHGVPQGRRPLVQPHAVPRTQILIISNIFSFHAPATVLYSSPTCMSHGGSLVIHWRRTAPRDHASEKRVGRSPPTITSGAWHGFRKSPSGSVFRMKKFLKSHRPKLAICSGTTTAQSTVSLSRCLTQNGREFPQN